MKGGVGKVLNVEGMYDLHLHTYPCMRPRIGTDIEVGMRAADAGMAGIMLKCHFESTVSRAISAEAQLGNRISVFGGIVLNEYVGGFNSSAVEFALESGGKQVWMPTVDAKNHIKTYGSRGKKTYFTEASDGITMSTGLCIFDTNREVRCDVIDVLKMIAKYDVILGTGHLSKDEIFELVSAAKYAKVNKILITHAYWKVPSFELEDLKALVDMGAIIELSFCTISPLYAYRSIGEFVHAINEIGSQNIILSTDSGQQHNPYPDQALRVFVQCLFDSGIKEHDINVMTKDNPARLINN